MSPKYKLLLLDKPHDEVMKNYEDSFDIVNWFEQNSVEVIYTHLTKIAWDKYPNLKCVLCPVTSVNHLEPIPEKIKVIYLRDKQVLYDSVWSTAEWTVTAMLNLMRANRDELTRKKVGFIGYGRVGQQVANLLKGFDCDIMYMDECYPIYNNNSIIQAKETLADSIYSHADIITVHLSENNNTKGLVGAEAFQKMGWRENLPYFINSSRSSIVDANSLILALTTNTLKGCALDVIDTYDYVQKKQLYELRSEMGNRLIITPHIAGNCDNSRVFTDTHVLTRFFDELTLFETKLEIEGLKQCYSYNCSICNKVIVTEEELPEDIKVICNTCFELEDNKKWEGFK
jgi:phosphoglycerate dehydrogenase-like enzyme